MKTLDPSLCLVYYPSQVTRGECLRQDWRLIFLIQHSQIELILEGLLFRNSERMAAFLSSTSLPLCGNGRNVSSLKPSFDLPSNPGNSLHFLHSRRKRTSFTSSPRTLTVVGMAPPKTPGGKPKKVTGVVKLALEAGKATPAPPVGPALGSKGVNIMAFCKDYNARTADKAGYVIPVEVTIYNDRSFTFILKTPPASVLLLKAAGADKGSNEPKKVKVGKVTIDQLRAIAQEKLPDLNCSNIESAMRIIAGTAANMGIDVDSPILQPKEKVAL